MVKGRGLPQSPKKRRLNGTVEQSSLWGADYAAAVKVADGSTGDGQGGKEGESLRKEGQAWARFSLNSGSE